MSVNVCERVCERELEAEKGDGGESAGGCEHRAETHE